MPQTGCIWEAAWQSLRQDVRCWACRRPRCRRTRRSRYDSLLVDEMLVRSAGTAQPRVLSFQGNAFSLELEVTGADVMGQVVPGRICTVAMTSADGSSVSVDVAGDGFFALAGLGSATVRFGVTDDGGTYASEWIAL